MEPTRAPLYGDRGGQAASSRCGHRRSGTPVRTAAAKARPPSHQVSPATRAPIAAAGRAQTGGTNRTQLRMPIDSQRAADVVAAPVPPSPDGRRGRDRVDLDPPASAPRLPPNLAEARPARRKGSLVRIEGRGAVHSLVQGAARLGTL